jgi:hypothetical protein
MVLDAVSDGTIRNHDLFFFCTGGEICLASREALTRLRHDSSARMILARYYIPLPSDPESWVKAFENALSVGERDSVASNVFQGVSYGYPPFETETFSLNAKDKHEKMADGYKSDRNLLEEMRAAGVPVPESTAGWMELSRQSGNAVVIKKDPLPWHRRMFRISVGYKASPRQGVSLDVEDFSTPAYVRFTNKELERDGYYLRAVYVLSRNYKRLIGEGVSPLDIVNDPSRLKMDLPDFPPALLAR